ncbi:iron-sulfur cluster biosynthesis family protein [Lactobacillus helveticus]|uniref:iron-sulfur cluster biosynthesis family protein n=1 Tax=Lactobacillus helveticus TaxID=1587 RepID=UPI00197C838B|nr:iron-sulfur cluster biosynthesis family protein [Lactobacillus helveticus]MBN6050210.1 iron-sulfur cluster biosynthesis family protein [Lactobacillus helveticus]
MVEPISINIKPEAKKVIEAKMDPEHQIVILALDDGSNKYSKKGGNCAIGNGFQFVVLSQKDPKYDIKMENNAGLDLYTSPAETTYFEPGLVVNARNSTLSLSSDSGIIDGGMTVSQY